MNFTDYVVHHPNKKKKKNSNLPLDFRLVSYCTTLIIKLVVKRCKEFS